MKAKKLISLLIAGAMTLSLVPSTGVVALAEEQVQETVGATVAPTQEAVEPTPTQEVADATPTPTPTQEVGDILDVFAVSNPRLTVLNGIEPVNSATLYLDDGSITITSTQIEQGGDTIPYTGGKVRITQSDSDTPTANTIKVNAPTTLILENINIETSNSCISASYDVTLNLVGDNKVTSTAMQGIYSSDSLTIDGTGSITATSTDMSGNGIYVVDDVTINGGTVTAIGTGMGGYGFYVTNGNIIIKDGTVKASGGNWGVGLYSSNGNVEIDGGFVTATGGDGDVKGNAIIINGGSVNVANWGDTTPTNSNGDVVTPVQFDLTSLGINGAQAVSYMVDGGKRIPSITNSEGKLCLYLTLSDHTVDVFVNGVIYTYSVDEQGNVSGGERTGACYDLSKGDVEVDDSGITKVYVWQSNATENGISIIGPKNLILENINTTKGVYVGVDNTTLTLVGSNTISNLECDANPHITIGGDGSLNLSWIDHGGQLDAKLSLTINSGKVTLTDGIGSHNPINALTINGGYFEIPQFEANSVVINGGSVKVTNWNGIQPTNGNGDNVYLREVTIPDKSADVTYTVDSGKAIPASTDDSGKLYLYLTDDIHKVDVNCNGKAYTCTVSNDVKTVTAEENGQSLDIAKGRISVSNGKVTQNGKEYTLAENKLKVYQTGVALDGSLKPTSNNINIGEDDFDLTLSGVYIDLDSSGGIYSTGNLSLTVEGENLIESDGNATVDLTGDLTIDGTGKLDIANYSEYPAIFAEDGSVTINGGDVGAYSKGTSIYAAEDLTINGGNVKAVVNGTAGKGLYSHTGDVIINGGYVEANDGEYGIYATEGDIIIDGGSVKATMNKPPKNSEGKPVQKYEVDLSDTDETNTENLDVAYMLDDSGKWIKTTSDSGSLLHLYLTEDEHTVEVRINNIIYKFEVGDRGVIYQEQTGKAYDLKNGSIIISGGTVNQDGANPLPATGKVYIYQSNNSIPTANTIYVNTPCELILEDINISQQSDNPLYLNADTTLNLVGKNKVTSTSGIGIYAENSLTIDGTGSIETTGGSNGIAANKGNITIENATVTATGNYGILANSSNITIENATVTAIGGSRGIYANKGNITIENATVTATGPEGIFANGGVTIENATVNATGSNYGIYANSNVEINSGTVNATANGEYGRGIFANSSVTIENATVTATANGEDSYGIFAGNGNIEIKGGTVTATGGYCGIYAVLGKTTIEGGTVTSTGGNMDIYSFTGITINGGSVKAEESKMNFTPKNGDGDEVHRKDITIPDKSADVTYTVDGGKAIPASTDEDGKLYFFLTNSAHKLSINCNGKAYTCDVLKDGTVGSAEFDAYTIDLADGNIEIQNDKVVQNGADKIQGEIKKLRITQSNNTEATPNTIEVGVGVSDLNLILSGVNINSFHVGIDSSSDLTLTVEGENTITSSIQAGVYTRKSITIDGAGSLTVNNADTLNGIYASDNVTINGGTVTATGIETGIYAGDNVTINGGKVTAKKPV